MAAPACPSPNSTDQRILFLMSPNLSISLMDDIARATLKTSNQALVTSIDRSIESGIASKIVLFDKNIPTFSG